MCYEEVPEYIHQDLALEQKVNDIIKPNRYINISDCFS